MVATTARGAAGIAAPLFVLALVALSVACAARTPRNELDRELARYAGREIERVRFVNPGPFSADTLSRLVETKPTRCSLLGLPICLPFTRIGEQIGRLDPETLQQDVRRIERFYRQSGYFGTRVTPVVEPTEREAVTVDLVIRPGQPVYLESLKVEGIEGILDPRILRRLPLEAGELFNLVEFAASADTIRRALTDRGYAYAQVLRNYTVDTVTDRATARLVAVPGPQVRVDSIIVTNAEHLGRKAVLRQLTFRKGDLLRADQLIESQRNLYELEIVQFATVTIAPDSLQVSPRDRSRATVLVQITEAPVHVVEAAIGFGTVDCIRSEVRWVNRSVGGGARRLELRGAVSKIGVGGPTGTGLGSSICSAFEGDTFANRLDYRFSAELNQPWFLGPRNQLTVTAFAERQSEPDIFQFEAVGGRFAVVRRLTNRETLTGIIDVERGRTIASQAVFCATFLVCLPSDIAALSRSRWLNTAGLAWVRDRSLPALDPTRGYLVSAGLTWAASWLGTDIRYVRGVTDASRYIPIKRERVLVTRLRLGSFFGTASLAPGGDFIPPEERFYAGGATTVRGFGRNELGPGVYVGETPVFDRDAIDFFPIGGTGLVVGNLELRFPAPIARDVLRLAAFVDGGVVTLDQPGGVGGNRLRVTPGVGLRARTPVGPVRLDVGFNPYAPTTAPLYLPDETTGALIRVLDRFTPGPPTFLERFRIHLAVGQPF